jgi:lipopolysaccharide biosynthesis protein
MPWYEPASFDAFVLRSAWGRVSNYPDHWRTDPGITIEHPARIAVLVHVYFPELLPEILSQLHKIPVDYDLIVTNSSGRTISIEGDHGLLRSVRVLTLDNRGRDIWPSVAAVNSGILDPYLIIFKIHTKKSGWRAGHAELEGDGDRWRQGFISQLLGDTDNIRTILSAFRDDPTLGVVTADGSALGPEMWGDNQRNTAELARRLEMDVDESDLRFPAGSVYWCRGIVLQGLRALALTETDFDVEGGHINGTVAHAVERLIGIVTTAAGLQVAERSDLAGGNDQGGNDQGGGGSGSWKSLDGRPLRPGTRIVPFYLPQFHPFPENNKWWGEGFTEWTNVVAARPVYHGHNQPRLPADLGFYDLRLDEVRTAQAELARFAGIEGFMYYYYWFAGKRLMSAPIEALLNSKLDQPFCIMWANENWTRKWDGNSDDVLIGQDYDRVSAAEFLDDIAEFLADPRYLTISGRKVISVYKPSQMANFPEIADLWRQRARALGLGELYLMFVDVGPRMDGIAGTQAADAFDGSLGFPPHNHLWSGVNGDKIGIRVGFAGLALSYPEMANDSILRLWSDLDPTDYPAVMVNFDNTARRQNSSDIWYGSNPYQFRRWLAAMATAVSDRDRDRRVVFINAWNEWAEAAILEPTERHGRSYLLAVRDVALG